jgi:fumarylacetoacetase
MKITANDPVRISWLTVKEYSHFPIQNLPFGIFSSDRQRNKRVGVAIGDKVLDIAACYEHKMIDHRKLCESSLNNDYLNDFMSMDAEHLREIRDSISILLRDDNPKLRDDHEMVSKVLIPVSDVTISMPVKVSNYTDFYSSKEHAVNLGSLFRDKDNPLPPNWLHMPIAYDGRSGSIGVSGC